MKEQVGDAMIKVLIADDQELIRESLKIVLSEKKNITVAGTAKNGREVIQFIRRDKPDVILMDVRMPIMDGVQCTQIIKENYPDVKIIILTTFDDDEYVYNALKHGASGYLLKGVTMEELVDAIDIVYKGGAMINSDVANKVLAFFSRLAKADYSIPVNEKWVSDLGKTEWRIIEQVGCGLSNREIAGKLALSEGTVRNYISIILSKLDLRDRTQLAIWAVQTGIYAKGDGSNEMER